jgi:hypothetical protein
MRFFFFVSLSRLLRTPFAEKREKREMREMREVREILSLLFLRDVSAEKQKRIIEEYSRRQKGANSSIDFF